MAIKHGITTETVQRLILDAGAVYASYGETGEVLIGATREGSTFAIEQDVREIPLDGARGPLKGARRIVEVRAQLTANVLEVGKENIMRILVGSQDTTDVTHDIITRNRDIIDADYLDNVALVATVSGRDEPIVCMVKNVIADGEFSISTADRDEAVVEMQFTGHFDTSELDEEPWEIRFPLAT